MRWLPRRGRRLVALATAAVTLPLSASLSQAAAAPPTPTPAPYALVPQPVSQQAVAGEGFTLTPQTRISVLSRESDSLGVGKYLSKLLAPSTGYDLKVVKDTRAPKNAIVLDPDGPKKLGAEGYTISSGKNGVVVKAHGAEGLFRGVQTLRQLLPAAVESRTKQSRTWTVSPVEINDAPRYEYRGVMLDVARRFFPVDQVKRYIDEAAAYKINTLHLHLTDDQGWRIAIDALPSLTKVGASTQSGFTGGTGWYYTKEDYKEIVSYASSRFMTVVPEIDGPGHTMAALASVPELNCDNKAKAPYSGFDVGISLYCLEDGTHVGNVRRFLKTVIKEVSKLTPGPYIHLGGDETPQATPERYAAYVKAATEATVGRDKTVMGWHQLGQSAIPSGSIMQYWGEDDDRESIGTAEETESIRFVRNGVSQGAKFVMSPSDHAYLDMKYDVSTPYGLSWSGYVPVQRSYEWDPATITGKMDGTGSIVPAKKIAGVEAALWADRAYEGSGSLPTPSTKWPEPQAYADYMSFPRLPALAEVGWSPQSARDWDGFRQRLAQHGPRWTAAGIAYHAAPGIPWPGTVRTVEGVHSLEAGGVALENGGSSSDGSDLLMWAPNRGNNQTWTIAPQSDGTYTLTNKSSGKCAEATGGAGSTVVQRACNGQTGQRWKITPTANDRHTITSAGTGLLLTAASAANGAKATQQPDTGSTLQRWSVD
ncbi:family 20 glycosylhydrolase [Streptomyces sp. BE20]|uniref:family 20 glycosylhydrolase n=1 Tax=unclassified Streptomyces TaxID=2593676 RepID=UPI002E790B2C|nr:MULTISPECIES: family 20 glycosylhydrolase [unclassified Streptomyces]MED7948388.1 family 20 glycosylhydrolase [Streptomyces sp. BE303]MEE1822301.1 family 20 glycosylhydrolase [Streptomyces sp. BE20]